MRYPIREIANLFFVIYTVSLLNLYKVENNPVIFSIAYSRGI